MLCLYSGVQQNESVIHIRTYCILKIFFPVLYLYPAGILYFIKSYLIFFLLFSIKVIILAEKNLVTNIFCNLECSLDSLYVMKICICRQLTMRN